MSDGQSILQSRGVQSRRDWLLGYLTHSAQERPLTKVTFEQRLKCF